MQLLDLIIVILLAILFSILFFRNKNNNYKNNKISSLSKSYTLPEKTIILSSNIEQMPVSNVINNIIDKDIISPKNIKPFDITENIPINNTYDVQPGLYDNQPLPSKILEEPIATTINKTLDKETIPIEFFNEEEKTISQLYDELVNTSKFKNNTKESLNETDRVLPAYKGTSLDVNNWTLYKNDKFLNGGNYDTLIGINPFDKTNTFRIPDSYNDFELKEFI